MRKDFNKQFGKVSISYKQIKSLQSERYINLREIIDAKRKTNYAKNVEERKRERERNARLKIITGSIFTLQLRGKILT